MIVFDNKNRRYTVTFNGTIDDYVGRIRAIMRLLAIIEDHQVSSDTIYHAATLVEQMLPTPQQIDNQN